MKLFILFTLIFFCIVSCKVPTNFPETTLYHNTNKRFLAQNQSFLKTFKEGSYCFSVCSEKTMHFGNQVDVFSQCSNSSTKEPIDNVCFTFIDDVRFIYTCKHDGPESNFILNDRNKKFTRIGVYSIDKKLGKDEFSLTLKIRELQNSKDRFEEAFEFSAIFDGNTNSIRIEEMVFFDYKTAINPRIARKEKKKKTRAMENPSLDLDFLDNPSLKGYRTLNTAEVFSLPNITYNFIQNPSVLNLQKKGLPKPKRKFLKHNLMPIDSIVYAKKDDKEYSRNYYFQKELILKENLNVIEKLETW